MLEERYEEGKEERREEKERARIMGRSEKEGKGGRMERRSRKARNNGGNMKKGK